MCRGHQLDETCEKILKNLDIKFFKSIDSCGYLEMGSQIGMSSRDLIGHIKH